MTRRILSPERALLESPHAVEAARIWCLEHPSLCALADALAPFYGTLPADPTRDQRGAPWRAADPLYVAESAPARCRS
ncbi:MAG: hypothetical protein JWP11_3685 [Frankiales bacterium]|nr:hypothetical protein [Frankiales bacterium]